MAGHPFRSATRRCLGEPLPHQLADRPQAYLQAIKTFYLSLYPDRGLMRYYLRFREAIPHSKENYPRVTHPFATIIIISLTEVLETINLVQLACVMHAVSVNSEPGSNSPLIIMKIDFLS